MVAQSKVSTQTKLRTPLDLILVVSGVLVGGTVALLVIWLWFDYQGDPSHSLPVILSTNFVGVLPNSLKNYLITEAQLMGLPLTGQTSAFWYMARSGGIVAYLLLWLSIVWGLTLSTKISEGLMSASIAYGLHEFLSMGAVLFAILHAVFLLGDEYIQFTIFHLAIPFLAPYEPVWTGFGTVALYLGAALTASFYLRKQIGQRLWRSLHYFTFVTYVLVLVHSLMAGTDSTLAGMRLIYLSTGFTVLFLIYYRLFTLKIRPRSHPGGRRKR